MCKFFLVFFRCLKKEGSFVWGGRRGGGGGGGGVFFLGGGGGGVRGILEIFCEKGRGPPMSQTGLTQNTQKHLTLTPPPPRQK